METRAVSVSICSTCGERLNVNGVCAVCLVRAGLSPSPTTEFGPADASRFGDFKIERREDGSFWELGRGAMGVTYLAVDKVLRRRVALKVIEVPEAARGSQSVRERFLREARAAAASAASECRCRVPVRRFAGFHSLLLRDGAGRRRNPGGSRAERWSA